MYPDNTDSVAQDQIRAFVDRILRMKEEAKAIKDDIREIYAEARGNGFDKTVLGKLVIYVEKRKSDKDALTEGEALFDLYLSAYDGAMRKTGTVVATHTHAPEAIVAKTGEITHPIQPETAAQTVPALPVVASSAEHEAVESSATYSPETAHEQPGTLGSSPSDAAREAGRPATYGQLVTGGESAATLSVATAADKSGAEQSASAPAPQYVLRPHCLHPELCAGQGRQHCYACTKAMAVGGVAA